MTKKDKTCVECGTVYPATAKYFHRQRRNKDGLRGRCRQCRKKYAKENYLVHKDYLLRNIYGLTLVEFDKMFEDQGGSCKICGGVNKNGDRLSVDHDHKTGKIRGLLCARCNSLLGLACDDTSILLEAIRYLTC